jgi:hypothetical protein
VAAVAEPAAERPARPAPESGGGNILQRKIGPLPGWAWAGLAGAAALAWWYFRSRGTGAGQATDSGTAAADPAAAVGDDIQGQLATIQTEIQNLQGEESQEGATTPANSGTGSSGSSKPAIRHVSTGKETLNQIARGRNTSVAHIVAVSKAGPESAENLAKLVAWARHPGTKRKGIVYYTSHGPVEGGTP